MTYFTPANDIRPADRFDLRGWAGGYAIYDRGRLITTFHGPEFHRAARHMRRLIEEAAHQPEPPEAA